MATYQVAWNATTKVAKIQPDGAAVGTGFTDIGSFDHDNDEDDNLGIDETHVYYHHVNELLYKHGVMYAQSMQIIFPAVSISATPATATLDIAADETLRIAVEPSPTNARVSGYTYESSDEGVATVDETGLVTPVATGEATITVEELASGATDTVVVTVEDGGA